MKSLSALRNADLSAALEQLTQDVRNDPASAKHRIFLFQLLAVVGQWERSLTQLKVAGEMDPAATLMAQMYGEALRCEALRSKVFAGQRSPLLFGEPEPWLASMIEALRLTTDGHIQQAEQLREEALESAPATSGRLVRRGTPSGEEGDEPEEGDKEPFAWLADADSRLGPILEAVVNGRYYWVPLHRIRRLSVEAPTDLRDLVWVPAYFQWANGGETPGLIPTRYPGSENETDDLIRMARKTEWRQLGPNTYVGSGQRLLATDATEYPLLDVERIEFAAEELPLGEAEQEDQGDA
jgi:type VI secretion system protein ImpE